MVVEAGSGVLRLRRMVPALLWRASTSPLPRQPVPPGAASQVRRSRNFLTYPAMTHLHCPSTEVRMCTRTLWGHTAAFAAARET